MRSFNPLAAFAVLITLIGLYQNWGAVSSPAWWTAAMGGAVLAALHAWTRNTAAALGLLALVLAACLLLDSSMVLDQYGVLASGLACGVLAGLAIGWLTKKIAAHRQRQPR
jgi:hypothetical protein